MKKPIFIGIAGPSGSGKSLMAKTIFNEIGSDKVVMISEDSYYKNHSHLSMEERTKINYDHPHSFDHELLHEQMLQLRQGHMIHVPVYNHAKYEREQYTQTIKGDFTLVVIEGVLLFEDERVRNLMNIRIFMDTPMDICLIRRIRRDIIERGRTLESVLQQYEKTVRPMFLQFIEPSKKYADIIVPRGGENRIAIDMIKAKMKELLNGIS